MKEVIWVTKDKRAVRVCDMETRHIVNSINLIKRSRRWRRAFLPRLQLELEIRQMGLKS